MTVRNLNFDTINSAIGELMIVASEKNITQILWQEQFDDLLSHQQLIFNQSQVHHPLIESAKQQLLAYFERTLKCFKLPLSPQGTTFQKQSWHALQQIPFGKTISYCAQAVQLGNANKARAVGLANSKNPIPIVIPYHHVIGKNGTFTGFRGSIDRKRVLLEIESTAKFLKYSYH